MHRSGTSALTRVLNLLGAQLPSSLMGPGEGNETGHWESQKLVAYHDQFLSELGSAWYDWRPLDVSSLTVNRREQVRNDISNIINSEYKDASLFVLKDPRVCRFVDFFLDILESDGIRVAPVIIIRNPLEVSASLRQRELFWFQDRSEADALLLWLAHILNAERATRGRKRAILSYDQLMTDWKSIVPAIATQANLEFPVTTNEAAPLVADFLVDGMRHHSRKANEVALDPISRGWVSETFEAMVQLTVNPKSTQAVGVLDRVYEEFLKSASIIENFMASARGAARSAAEDAKQTAAAIQASLAERTAELDQVRAELRRMAALEEELESARQTGQELAAEAARWKGRAQDALKTQRQTLQSLFDRHESVVAQLAEQKATLEELKRTDQEKDRRVGELEAAIHEQSARYAQAVAENEDRLSTQQSEIERQNAELQARQEPAEKTEVDLANLRNQIEENQAILSEWRARLGQLTELVKSRDAAIEYAQHELARLHESYRTSTSWKLTAPFRGIAHMIRGTENLPAPTYDFGIRAEVPPVKVAFFTICSRNFLAYARTLAQSLKTHHPESDFYVALCDAPDAPFDPANEPFPFVYLDDLDLPQWREMSQRYNITEFNTAIKPFVISHLMRKDAADCVVYLDPDILVTSRMEELLSAFANGANLVLTPHVTMPAENTEVSDIKMLQYGIYNLGFVGFRTGPKTLEIVEWWGRRLINDCVIKLEDGLFVDQKWADLLPAMLSPTCILRHPGYNVAYWNMSQRAVVRNGGGYFVNGEPMRFAHFSGSKIEDPSVYSRHSGQFNINNIGDLKLLLDEYRALVLGNGHEALSKIPYAYSWNGAAGINLHTPQPDHQQTDALHKPANDASVAPAAETRELATQTRPIKDYATPTRPSTFELIKTGARMSGGMSRLIGRTGGVFLKEGMSGVRRRVEHVRTIHEFARYSTRAGQGNQRHAPGKATAVSNQNANRLEGPNSTDAQPVALHLPSRRRLLFIDWSTPRPDRDAGSVTAFHLMQILKNLGFDVTFIPSDLEYLGDYTEALRSIGIECLHREDIGSIKDFLKAEGSQFVFAFLCRAPIAMHYMEDIRSHAPDAKIILNTSDLHYLRDIRNAELEGSKEKLRAAQEWKLEELKVINRCDLAIVMSPIEHAILAQDAPDANVRLIPLMFVDICDDVPPFEERRDILFIGGFPHMPNVDAALYFAREIFPLVKRKLPDVVWHVVGNAPPTSVLDLARQPGIVVHGFVHDIAPIFRKIRLTVAPLRVGAGIKGKIGTSLSFGVPVVATSIAAEGMNLEDDLHVSVADDPQAFADAIIRVYEKPEVWQRLSSAGRQEMLERHSVPSGHRRIGQLFDELSDSRRRIDIFDLRSLAAYRQLQEVWAREFSQRRSLEYSLIKHDKPNFYIPGFCAVCGKPSKFNTGFMYAYESTDDGKPVPNWREHLYCVNCGMQNRLRASMHLFYDLIQPRSDDDIYITEQTTALFRWLQARHPNIVGSEFFGDLAPFGSVHNGIRNEDMTRLTFADNCFDHILSFDVMEHVADDIPAIAEAYRCLKPGGKFFFSAPFAKDRATKIIRARMNADGSIEHLMTPEYHANPVDPEGGALCFRYFAWDLLDDMRAAGFENARILHYWSRDYAYFGVEQFIFVGEKPSW